MRPPPIPLRWCAGSGLHRAPDPLRTTMDLEVSGRINPYFRDFYQQLAGRLGNLHAAEHTAERAGADGDRERRAT